MDPLAPLLVAVNGSWSRPGWYHQFCDVAQQRPDDFAEEDRAEALRDAIRLAIDDQVEAGADIITDGEMARPLLHFSLLERLTGLERSAPTQRLGPPSPHQVGQFLCVAPVTGPKGLGIVDEYKRLAGMTKARIKVCVPGPLMLASAVTGGKVYRNRESIVDVMMPIVNRELRALVEAGAETLQIDEPGFAIERDKTDAFVRLVERTAAGVRAFVTLHVGFGNDRGRPLGPRSYGPLFPDLGKCAVRELAFEFANREMAEVELLAKLKPPLAAAVGLIDVKSLWVEPPELVADRLRLVLKQIEPERVRVTTDGGFEQTSRSLARAKLANLVSGVKIVRDERGL